MTRFERIPTLLAACAAMIALPITACGRGGAGGDDGQMPPPAAALSPAGTGLTLDQKLEQIDDALSRVLDRGLDDETRNYVYTAEALTDRLLEDQPPVEWLASGYDVEARLRQIQALADRLVAEMRREVASELVLADAASLRFATRDLRKQIAAGGEEAPPPIDSLLNGTADQGRPRVAGAAAQGDSTSGGQTTTTSPSTPGLLGTPIE